MQRFVLNRLQLSSLFFVTQNGDSLVILILKRNPTQIKLNSC